MEKEIRHLIINQSICGKFIDKDFIKQLINISIIKNGLEKYVLDLTFSDLSYTKEKIVCVYNNGTKHITIDLNSMKRIIYSQIDTPIPLDRPEIIFYKNIIITQCILHELVHASQDKQSNSANNDIETKIIKIANKTFKQSNCSLLNRLNYQKRQQQWKKYMQNYHLCPLERLAEIRSHQIITNAIAPIASFIPNVYQLEQDSIHQNMIAGYQEENSEIIAPTPIYLERLGYKKDWKKLEFFSNDARLLQENVSKRYPLEQRLTLGLPITKEEYHKQQKILIKK